MKLSKCEKKTKKKNKQNNPKNKQTNKQTEHYKGILRHLQEYI